MQNKAFFKSFSGKLAASSGQISHYMHYSSNITCLLANFALRIKLIPCLKFIPCPATSSVDFNKFRLRFLPNTCATRVLTLASAIAIDRATIGGIVDRLVAKGLVQRQTNSQDRRARVLSLTDEGHRILTRLHPVVQNVQDIILQNLTAEETRGFMRLAAKISAQDETTGAR
jgi:DNA-binding MarR family transcriptional regulator